ncbi:DUF6174 domain-containing protein [Marinobacter sp. CHS3-4]|uniref:DUF6174 domain-containing protein n=1 Tax=Marinobacter sp. CHS3-4 TaxID=3045174 RepID=UPI0024B55224|nr:DUF6174 domain-containing protein [Marinobacter sp. CHS3-4]MDI9244491.1 DUF6174 domain-containing protein [Marinobacter sp. CHS3-4]
MNLRTLVALAFSSLLVGCGSTVSNAGSEPDRTTLPESLEEARQLWKKRDIENYAVTAQMTCYCPQDLLQPIRLEIKGGKVVATEGLQRPLENLTREDAERMTVDGLFRFVEDAQRRDAHLLDVSYDDEYGFPTLINYDGHKMIADDERQYRLSDFEPGALR